MDNNVGTRIRRLRKARKLNIKELSDRLGLSASFIGLVERNDRDLSNKSLIKLADIFNVTIDNSELTLKQSKASWKMRGSRRFSNED